MGYPYDPLNTDSILEALGAYQQGSLGTNPADPRLNNPAWQGLNLANPQEANPLVNPGGPLPPSNSLPGAGLPPAPGPVPGAPMVPGDSDYGAQPQVPAGSPYAYQAPGSTDYKPPVAKPGRQLPIDLTTAGANEELQAAADEAKIKSGIVSADLEQKNKILGGEAAAQEQHSKDLAVADLQYQQNRAKAHQDAALETAKWVDQMDTLARTEPNPHRYWENQDAFGKGLWLAGMLGSLASQIGEKGAGQRPNPVIQMLEGEITKDVQSQKDRLSNQRDVLKQKGDIMLKNQAMTLSDLHDDHSMVYTRLDSLQKALVLRAQQMSPDDQNRMSLLAGADYLGQARQKIILDKNHELAQIRAKKVEQDHAAWMQKSRQTFEESQKALDRQLARDLTQEKIDAKISAGIKAGPEMSGPFKAENTGSFSPATTGINVITKNQDGTVTSGPLVVAGQKNEEAARQLADSAPRKYQALNTVASALHSDTGFDVLLKRDPALQAAIIELGYASAKDFDRGGRVNDKDYSLGVQSQIGGDLDTVSGRVMTITGAAADQGKLADFVDTKVRNYPKEVSVKLGALVDPRIHPGNVEVQWTPPKVTVAKPEAVTGAREINAEYGIGSPPTPLQTQQHLEEAQALEAKGIKTLPPYQPGNQPVVTKFNQDAKGALPDDIRERASKALDEVKGDPRATQEIIQASNAASNAAQRALDAYNKHIHDWASKPIQDHMTYTEAVEAATKIAHDDHHLTQIDRAGVLKALHDFADFRGPWEGRLGTDTGKPKLETKFH